MESRSRQDLILTHSLMLGERLYLFARLRFAAAAGIVVAALFATYVLGIPGLSLAMLAGAALVMTAYNAGVFALVRPHRGARAGEQNQRRLVSIAHVSILLDYLVLTFAIWQVGGAASPFLAFYLLHAILSAVLLSRRAAYAHASVGYLCLVGLVLGEGWGIIPRHPLLGGALASQQILTILFVYGLLTAVTTALTTGIVRLLREYEQGLLAASERLEQLADVRRSFLHVVVHDVRSPVGTVVAMLEGLGNGIDGPLSEAQKQRVERAGARLRSALDLLHGLRVLADLETEGLDGLMAPVDVPATVAAAVEDHLDAAAQKRQKIEAVPSGPLPPIHGIERLIREALANYLSNAIKYTGEGGAITVRAVPRGPRVRIEVVDNGPGIGVEEQARLFQEFTRVSRAGGDDRKVSGLGLGLSIVRRIAEAHHGRAGVESRPGQGSTFFIELPAGSAAEARAQ